MTRATYERAADTARRQVASDILGAFNCTCVSLSETSFTFVVRLDDETMRLLAWYAEDDPSLTVTTDEIRDGDDVHTQVRIVHDAEVHQALVAAGPFRAMTASDFARYERG